MPSMLDKVFTEVFGVSFSYGNFDHRLKMQKAIFLLENMGINIGDYGFFWYKHGPYSQDLQDDMYYLDKNQDNMSSQLKLTGYASEKIRALKDVFNTITLLETKYTDSMWLETLASLYYIRENIASNKASNEKIIEILMEKKPHLNEEHTNLVALELVNDRLMLN